MSNGNGTEEVGPDEQYRRSVHASERAELLKRQLANSDAHDKAILTLSSGLLALSLSFIKEILPAGAIGWTYVLYASWGALTVAVLCTVISFRVSDAALNDGMDRLHRYYTLGDEDASTKSRLSVWVDCLNSASAILFCAGLVLTVIFVSLNFSEAASMRKASSGGTGQKVVTVPEKRGQPVPQMQQVNRPQGGSSSTGQSPAQSQTPAKK